jgi:hypothetical protein
MYTLCYNCVVVRCNNHTLQEDTESDVKAVTPVQVVEQPYGKTDVSLEPTNAISTKRHARYVLRISIHIYLCIRIL